MLHREEACFLLHGLGGNSRAKYMISAAQRLMDAGFTVFRMDHRGVGKGVGWARRLYNAGLGCDIRDALRFLAKRHPILQFVSVGFSMSGNTPARRQDYVVTEAVERFFGDNSR